MTAHGPLKPNVKQQPAIPSSAVKLEAEDGQAEDGHDEDGHDEVKPEIEGPHFKPQYEDLTDLDDYENKMFEGVVIFTQPNGSNEPSNVTALRF